VPEITLCVWCIKPKEVHLSNGPMANLCECCTADIQRRAPAANRAKELPHLEERRARPMPSPFEKPKMDEFVHHLPND